MARRGVQLDLPHNEAPVGWIASHWLDYCQRMSELMETTWGHVPRTDWSSEQLQWKHRVAAMTERLAAEETNDG